MNGHDMHILVTIDVNYVHPLCVMLWSLLSSNPGESFDVHLMHAGLPEQDIMSVSSLLHSKGHRLHNHRIDDAMFIGAPVGFHFSRAMYYRLLAPALLPDNLERILYLDPDILILQPIASLYQTDLSHCIVAAAKETIPVLEAFCRLSLKLPLHYRYFNSGVMLMNLARNRQGSKRLSETIAILHFKGSQKPWRKEYSGMLKPLYTYYEASQRGKMP